MDMQRTERRTEGKREIRKGLIEKIGTDCIQRWTIVYFPTHGFLYRVMGSGGGWGGLTLFQEPMNHLKDHIKY